MKKSRKIINVYSDFARKHRNVTAKDFCKHEKLEDKKNKKQTEIRR